MVKQREEELDVARGATEEASRGAVEKVRGLERVKQALERSVKEAQEEGERREREGKEAVEVVQGQLKEARILLEREKAKGRAEERAMIMVREEKERAHDELSRVQVRNCRNGSSP
jgi:hypothetical protein